MTRRTAAALLTLALAFLPAASAPARALLGMGDQKPTLFVDPRFKWLDVHYGRIVVSWDVMTSKSERAWAADWLKGARRDGVQPLVTFGHGWSGRARRKLPTVGAYLKAFKQFRRAYPWIRTYAPWNEENHCSQPTCHHPERAAQYYDAVRSACPRCTVVAADVLDQDNMVPWLQGFLRAVKHKPTLWGLHNYLDANRLRSTGTDKLLRAVKGTVWITETGGVVHRNHYKSQISFPESPGHAAKVTSFVLKLADSKPRIARVYLYQWNADSLFEAWDSGLIDPFGQRRPAYSIVARYQHKNPAKAPADPKFPFPPQPAPPGPAGPGAEQPPPSGSGGGSGSGGSGSGGGSPTCVPGTPLCLPGSLGGGLG